MVVSKVVSHKLQRKLNLKKRVLGRREARQFKTATAISCFEESEQLKALWKVLKYSAAEEAVYKAIVRVYNNRSMLPAEKVEYLADLLLRFPEALCPKHLKDTSPICGVLYSHILNQLLQDVNGEEMKSFSYYGRDAEAALPGSAGLVPLRDVLLGGSYSSFIIRDSLRYAVKTYGKRDQETGEVIPFGQLFFAAYGLKNRNGKVEKAKSSDRACRESKQHEIKAYLSKLAENCGVDIEEKLAGYLTEQKVKELLDLLTVSDQQYDYAIALLSLGRSSSLTIKKEVGDGDNQEIDVTGEQMLKEQNGVERIGLQLAALMQRARHVADKKLRRHVIAFMTLKALPYVDSLQVPARIEVNGLIDQKFVEFILAYEGLSDGKRDRDVLIYAAYMGYEYDTARKHLRKAELFLSGMDRKAC